LKSPHAAVLGLHVGQVERVMRRRHAVGQTLPPVYPEKLSIIDRRQLSAAYPQSQKRGFWPVQQRLAAHEFTGVKLGWFSARKIQIEPLATKPIHAN
jgi:hypothetical protein